MSTELGRAYSRDPARDGRPQVVSVSRSRSPDATTHSHDQNRLVRGEIKTPTETDECALRRKPPQRLRLAATSLLCKPQHRRAVTCINDLEPVGLGDNLSPCR
jgi:hypothetical protein